MTSTISSLLDENKQSSRVISFIQSQKGKSLLILEKHIFKLNKPIENRKYWICTIKGYPFTVTKRRNDSSSFFSFLSIDCMCSLS